MIDKNYPVTHYELMSKEVSSLRPFLDLIETENGDKDLDFVVFAERLMDMPSIGYIFNRIGQQEASMTANMLYHMWRMKCCHDKIYYISGQLCSMLLNTNINVDCKWLRSPFEQIYLYLDQEEVLIKDDRMSDKYERSVRPVKGVYVNLRRMGNGINRMRFIMTSGADGVKELKDVNYHFIMDIPESGKSMDEIIKDTFKSMADNDIRVFDLNETNERAIALVAKMVFNILLYISNPGADVFPIIPQRMEVRKKSAHKAEKEMRKINRIAQKPFIMVGYNLPKLDTDAGIGKSISYRFDVRGHWRAQWMGSETDSSRRQEQIWIKPFQKGKDLVESLNRKYIVKE